MAFPLDLSQDGSIVEGREACTFYPLTSDGKYGPPIGPIQGKLMPISKKEIDIGDAELITRGAIWHLWKVDLGTVNPTYGGKIVQASTGFVFIINPMVDTVSLATRYRCVTMRAVGQAGA